jgi:small subunit ribosomal protein S9
MAKKKTKAKAKKAKAKVVNTSGKRKTAIARATVKAGKGRIRVNSEPIEILNPELARAKAMEPLTIASAMNRLADVDINVNTTGGGQMGQVDAIRTAIARGLVHFNGGAEGVDEELRDEFLRFDRSLLVNDPRRKEPKHQMGRGARAKWQKSYR